MGEKKKHEHVHAIHQEKYKIRYQKIKYVTLCGIYKLQTSMVFTLQQNLNL